MTFRERLKGVRVPTASEPIEGVMEETAVVEKEPSRSLKIVPLEVYQKM